MRKDQMTKQVKTDWERELISLISTLADENMEHDPSVTDLIFSIKLAQQQERQRVIEEVEEVIEKFVKSEAHRQCFKARTAQIFWDGWSEAERKEWVDKVNNQWTVKELRTKLNQLKGNHE